MFEKEPVAGLAPSSSNQAIALEETGGLRELLLQLIDERLRAVHAGLAEATRSAGSVPLTTRPKSLSRLSGFSGPW